MGQRAGVDGPRDSFDSAVGGRLRRILVPLDGSSFAESALPHARALSRAFGSELRLLTVLDPELTGATSRTSAECRLQLLEAEDYLERAAERLQEEGLEAGIEVREGVPTCQIVRSAQECGADLVVLAARSRREEAHLVSRGVAQGVVATGAFSLLLARGAGSPRMPGAWATAKYRSLAVALDRSPSSHLALELALAIARRDGAELLLLHVHAGGPEDAASGRRRDGGGGRGVGPAETDGRGWRAGSGRERGEAAADYLEDVRRAAAAEGVTVRARLLRSGAVPEAVEEAASASGLDLLVVGAHGAGEAGGPYGHCARQLLLQSQVPVLVVQDRPRDAASTRADAAPSAQVRPLRPPSPDARRPPPSWALS